MRPFACLVLAALLLYALPARADGVPTPDDNVHLATPKPDQRGLTPVQEAQVRIRNYVASIPQYKGLNVIVVPGTGSIPWPLAPMDQDVHAEVWSLVLRDETGKVGNPLMFFAVRTDNGEVCAMFVRNLQKEQVFN